MQFRLLILIAVCCSIVSCHTKRTTTTETAATSEKLDIQRLTASAITTTVLLQGHIDTSASSLRFIPSPDSPARMAQQLITVNVRDTSQSYLQNVSRMNSETERVSEPAPSKPIFHCITLLVIVTFACGLFAMKWARHAHQV